MADGKARVREAADNAKPLRPPAGPPDDGAKSDFGLPPRCPVTPLGLFGDVRYYLDAKHQLAALPARDHNRLNIMGMFGGDEFFYTAPDWVRFNADGQVTGWRPEIVASHLMAACGEAGIWDLSKRERGRGAWRGDDNELILHCGDRVLMFERGDDPWAGRQNHRPGLIGRYVYPSGERAGLPSDDAPPADIGEQLYDLLMLWNWRRDDLDAMLMTGWIGAAMIGGALAWRPTVWLTGGKGTGKSTLQGAVKHLFGDMLIDLADASPAYIWQTLRKQTLPVDVDELEAAEDNRRSLAIVDLARKAASGGRLGRGSDRHVPIEFTLRSCFMFSSVLIPPLGGPDRSRIAILDLRELNPDAPAPDIDPRVLRRMGAQLRRRMIDNWARFDDTVDDYRRALAEAGHGARAQDQFGTLLACADILIHGARRDAEAAVDLVRRMRATDLAETADDQTDEQQCLQHLLGAPINAHRGGELLTLGEWINRALGRSNWDDVAEAKTIIARHGVRVERTESGSFLAIAHSQPALQALYENTRWRTPRGVMGVWVQALRRLPGAERGGKAFYFGGPSSKAVLVPTTLVPEPDQHRQQPLPS